MKEIEYNFEILKFDQQNLKTVPIIINNYNRLEFLDKMLKRLNNMGYHNIYIIDNNSKYKPLLSYYKKNNLKIFRLKENIGYLSIWESGISDLFIDGYYIYSDPDIFPDIDCPHDFVDVFKKYLDMFQNLDKVGFGLRIDDLPDHYNLKKNVILHESKFWENKICDGLYDAKIDTTFALYRPGAMGPANLTNAGRTDFPYMAQHLPWYIDHSNLTKEERWYLKCNKIFTHWSNHPENFNFFKKYYLLIKKDDLPLIWNIRKFGRKVLNLVGIKKKKP